MKVNPAVFYTLVVLLLLSFLVNLMALTRLGKTPPPSTPEPVRSVASARPSPREDVFPEYAPIRENAQRPVVQSAPDVFVAPVPAPKKGAIVPASSVRDDPGIAEVLDAQEQFSAYSKDLDKLVKAKDRLDYSKYVQANLAVTMDFLQIGETARNRFTEASRMATAGMTEARREYEASRNALAPRDKNDPASNAVYQQQRNAIDVRYQQQVTAAVGTLRGTLDPGVPRHREFLDKADKWLRDLAPKPAKP